MIFASFKKNFYSSPYFSQNLILASQSESVCCACKTLADSKVKEMNNSRRFMVLLFIINSLSN